MYQLKDYLYSINQSKKSICTCDTDAEKKYPAFVVIVVLLAAFGVYKAFFANEGLADPWDDHDD